MKVLLPIGVVLILAGVGGSIGACYQSGRDAADQVEHNPSSGPTGGVPADRTDESTGSSLLLGMLSGLAMAGGVGCIAVGMGHWNHPTPSYTRPANPWSDQPGEKHEPPTGLV